MSDSGDDNPKQRAFVLLRENRIEEAATALANATQQFPQDAEAWCVLGAVEGMRGQYERAIDACRRALSLHPAYAEAWCNLGASLADTGQTREAIDAYRQALAVRPAYPGVLYNLGNLYRQTGDEDSAIASYRASLAHGGGEPAIHLNLGLALADRGQFLDAIDQYQAALARHPDYPEAWNNLGVARFALGENGPAIEAYRQALRCNPRYVEARCNLGVARSAAGELAAAIDEFRLAEQIEPRFAPTQVGLGNALLKCGRARDALTAFREACRLDPDNSTAQHNLLFALNYDPDLSPDDIALAHRHWGKSRGVSTPPSFANSPDPERRLRIGYVSPDFRAHSVAHFIAPVLARHDPQAIEVYCYANVRRPDAVTERLQSHAHRWRSIFGVTAARVVDLVRSDEIDILIDLAGHSADNRLDVFAQRTAPIQASYLGYPNTTGLDTVDHFLTDAQLDVSREPEPRYSERLIRLPFFCCYEPPSDAPPVSPTPWQRAGYITFGSFQNLAKVNEALIDAWAQILRATPQSRLLMQAVGFTDETVRREWLGKFASRGIEAECVELIGPTGFADHLALHGRVDIALDSFVWSGHTSTCHTLWMGVPVVALAGRCHAARMSADILRAIGTPELVATDADGYVQLATELAHNPERLLDLRTTLRSRMQMSPLCDADAHVRALESAYRAVWRDWCQRQALVKPSSSR